MRKLLQKRTSFGKEPGTLLAGSLLDNDLAVSRRQKGTIIQMEVIAPL